MLEEIDALVEKHNGENQLILVREESSEPTAWEKLKDRLRQEILNIDNQVELWPTVKSAKSTPSAETAEEH